MINGQIDAGYILTAVLISAAITFGLRLLPFGIKRALAGSALLEALKQWLPLGAVILLGIFAMTRVDLSSPAGWVPQAIATVVTIAVHLWKRNLIYSMVAGTVTCVVLATWVF